MNTVLLILTITSILIATIAVCYAIESERNARFWEKAYKSMFEWLATNLGEHGDFSRDDNNVINFTRRR